MNKRVETGKSILKTLTENGWQAFFVGGFVRDHLLGHAIDDIDITTDATPEDVMGLFPNTRKTGVKYGTVSVMKGHYSFEVTTFRSEQAYVDYRHPESVIYGKSLAEDLKRRDFTINAMAMGLDGQIIDLFEGQADLDRHVIRAIGDAEMRFQEDALRILRAFRFIAKLDFQLDSMTEAAMRKSLRLVDKISNERIMVELAKIHQNPYRKSAYQAMLKVGLDQVFPELALGLNCLASQADSQVDDIEFYCLSFHLAQCEIPDRWRFSRIQKQRIDQVLSLLKATEDQPIDWRLLYQYQLPVSRIAERLNRLIHPYLKQQPSVQTLWKNLPIKTSTDLSLRGEDVRFLSGGDDQRIGQLLDQAVRLVNSGQVPNEKEPLLQALARIPLE